MAKLKKCRMCPGKFKPMNSMQTVCGPTCALAKAKSDNEKKFKAETVKRKKALKSRGDYTKEAQVEFNKFIRLRDHDQPCISCGRYHSGQYHAGHYQSVGAHPELRFEELNCHKQCSTCNNHLSGNLIEYRKSLVTKIGLDNVEWLEGSHEAKQYTIDELKDLKRQYRTRHRELKQQLAA